MAARKEETMLTNLHLKGSTLHYGQEYLRDVMAGAITFNEAEIKLVREPRNRYDANAVAVWWKGEGEAQKLGYVDKKQAVVVARCMDNGGRVSIRSGHISGSADTNYGLYLGAEVLFWKDIKSRSAQRLP